MIEEFEESLRSALASADLQWVGPNVLFTYRDDHDQQVEVVLEVKSVSTAGVASRSTTSRLFGDAVARELRRELDEHDDDLAGLGEPAELARRVVEQLPLIPSPLEDLTGPFYDTPSLTRWLGVTRQALDSRVRNKSLLGLPVQDGPRVYPAWQFAADKSTLPYFADLLKTLAAGTSDAWTWALWLSAPSDAHDGLTAYEWLANGRDPAPLLADARADAARWAA